jgi:hypothetical protein
MDKISNPHVCVCDVTGLQISETDKEMTLLVKPTVVPPGLNK